MNTIKIRVMDWYNKPEYYRFMTQEMFDMLEEAYNNNEQTIEVDESEHNKMVSEILTIELTNNINLN